MSQGPGWWIASDGRWYPPELHPSAQAPPSSQPQGAAPGASAQTTGVAGYPAASSVLYPPGYGPPPGFAPPPGVGFSGVAYGQSPGTAIDPLLHLALAPWWKRLLAILVDWMIIGVAGIIVLVVIGAAGSHSNTSSTSSQSLTPGQATVGFLGLFVLFVIPCMLYFGIMNGSRRGQTVGKMALSIAVRDARTGGPIGFWRGVGRYAMTVLFYLVFLIPYLIDNLSPLWDARRQAWHDKVVRSVVIDADP
ncbi:MAG TPA: RDD family protein [Acidimicrobiales bacterium]|nr:RDD family protein [Acidimicrobiales bacterium]